MNTIVLHGKQLTQEEVMLAVQGFSGAAGPEQVETVLSDAAWAEVRRAEQAVHPFLSRGEVIYGVSTGFGAFKDRIIAKHQVRQLQRNILMSRVVGVGAPLDTMTTRAMMSSGQTPWPRRCAPTLQRAKATKSATPAYRRPGHRTETIWSGRISKDHQVVHSS
jgi:hypothetical protein